MFSRGYSLDVGSGATTQKKMLGQNGGKGGGLLKVELCGELLLKLFKNIYRSDVGPDGAATQKHQNYS